MYTYKGTDINMRCRGYQFKLGKQEEMQGDTELCNRGFHSCEDPINTFIYYSPSFSRYFLTKIDEVSDETKGDTKKVSKKIKLLEEIGVKGIIKQTIMRHFDRARIKYQTSYGVDSDQRSDSGQGTLGRRSVRVQGRGSAGQSIFNCKGIQVIGDKSAGQISGEFSAAEVVGNSSAGQTSGIFSGVYVEGMNCLAQSTGNYSAAYVQGMSSAAQVMGIESSAQAVGEAVAAASHGDFSSASVEGEHSIACALGYNSLAKGSIGSYLVLVERGERISKDGKNFYRLIKDVKVVYIDGEIYKENTFYRLVDGEIVPTFDCIRC
ncbi:hypothetical protein M2140_000077 [Clostridiales Family XIII bacterium PM5-7]